MIHCYYAVNYSINYNIGIEKVFIWYRPYHFVEQNYSNVPVNVVIPKINTSNIIFRWHALRSQLSIQHPEYNLCIYSSIRSVTLRILLSMEITYFSKFISSFISSFGYMISIHSILYLAMMDRATWVWSGLGTMLSGST